MQGNIIGKILFVIGIVVIITGVFSAYNMANSTSYTGLGNEGVTMEWAIFLPVAGRAVVLGMVLIGLAEVIKLLRQLNARHREVEHLRRPLGAEPQQSGVLYEKTEESSDWDLEEGDILKIYELYSREAILEILPSKLEGYCVVKLQNDEGAHIKVVDIGGFSAEEVQNTDIVKKVTDWYEGER
ncbi:hypothetical protein [Virgibacillus ainsalahensis]